MKGNVTYVNNAKDQTMKCDIYVMSRSKHNPTTQFKCEDMLEEEEEAIRIQGVKTPPPEHLYGRRSKEHMY